MTHDMNKDEDNGLLPDALRWELRALRRDAEPDRDLWPSIAARLAGTPQVKPAPVVARRPSWRRFAPLATAASLALALGLAWQLRPVQAPAGPAAPFAKPLRPLRSRIGRAPTPPVIRGQPFACFSSVSASLTSNLPGASMFKAATLPSLTSIE